MKTIKIFLILISLTCFSFSLRAGNLHSQNQKSNIQLTYRVTNDRAIKAYHAWGFVPSPNTMEHWANLEYTVEQANGLQ